MNNPIIDAALASGYFVAAPATGHPFDVWRKRLDGIPQGKHLNFEHRPEAQCGWPVGEITLWCAAMETPPFDGWPEGYGEIASHYMFLGKAEANLASWVGAIESMGFETVSDKIIPDRAAAIRAGLGVHGQSGMLITPQKGTYVTLATVMVHMAPPEGTPGPENDMSPGCARCGACTEACPSGAIGEDGIDALACLRNHMNWPEFMADEMQAKMGENLWGCDVCQKVCPSNSGLRHISPTPEQYAPFKLESVLTEPDIDEIAAQTGKYLANKNRLQRQAVYCAAYHGRRDLLPQIKALENSDDPTIARAVRWAINTLAAPPAK